MSRKLFAALAVIAATLVTAGEVSAQVAPLSAPSASARAEQVARSPRLASASAVVEDAAETLASHRALLDRYCVTCHNERLVAGRSGAPSPLVGQLRAIGLTLDTLDLAAVDERPAVWERVVRKLRGGMMPPAGRPRPDDDATLAFTAWLENELVARPQPQRRRHDGAADAQTRLNRAEYRNAVRDLLALEVDVDALLPAERSIARRPSAPIPGGRRRCTVSTAPSTATRSATCWPLVDVDALLPADDSSYGFDNMGTALRMSQSLLERYLAAAKTVSRLAVGSPPPAVVGETYRLATDMQQHDRMDGLPFGTRGGALVAHLFPQEAEYDIRIELGRARNVSVTHRLEIAVDGEQVELVTLAPPDSAAGGSNLYANASSVTVRVPVPAGPHDVGVTFFRNPAALVEQVRLPFQNPRRGGAAGPIPNVASVTITGPYNPQGTGETPSRTRIFACSPAGAEAGEETRCAARMSTLARRAYRRPVTDDDLDTLLGFYGQERAAAGSFEAGIELALRWLLASPDFLFRIEAPPADLADADVYRIGDLELASRLSFSSGAAFRTTTCCGRPRPAG